MTETTTAAKQAMRKAMAARRDEIDVAERRRAAAIVASRPLSDFAISAPAIVGGYFPYRTEFDVHPLMRVLVESGHDIGLPTVGGADQPLVFRRYRLGDPLVANRFGIPEPTQQAPILEPTHLLVPLLAFDAQGYRLGYGGGYYDRTLLALRRAGHAVTAIGIGFDFQSVPKVPRIASDEPLDMILTERRLYRPQAGQHL